MSLMEEARPIAPVDEDRVRNAVAEILEAIAEDPLREGVVDTPERVARMYAEIFAGMRMDPREVLATGFEEGYDEMVVARDIRFFSMCEHHLVPFFGVAHIGYVPRGRVVGISKLARLTDILARRPQVQERLTTQIAETIVDVLQPLGVAVVVRARHLCMEMRGVRKPGSEIVTSVTRGVFRDNQPTRMEFFQVIDSSPAI
jgi:GTP cyclohydrolase I